METTRNEADVAIIGMAGRFPGADNVGELWQNLCDGVNAVQTLTDDEMLAAGVDPALLTHPNLVKVIAMPRGIDRFDATFFGFSRSGKNDQAGDPQVDAMIEKVRIERDDEARRSVIFDLQRHLAKAAYGFLTPGVAASFLMSWPALQNFGVYQGARANFRLWVDSTKAPHTS